MLTTQNPTQPRQTHFTVDQNITPHAVATLEGHSKPVTALTVLPDGRLASGSVDKTIKLWEVLSGRCMATLAGHSGSVYALTVLPEGRLASGSYDSTIKLWDVLSGRCMATLEGHSSPVYALTVLPDGRLASGSDDNTIKLWEVLSGRCMATLEGHSNWVRALTVLPDGRLASGSSDKTIKLWEVLSGRCMATLARHSYSVWALTVLPDGRLASGSLDKTIKLWEVLSGRCMATLAGHSDGVIALTVLPDGRLASGSGDKTIKLWEVLSGRCMATLAGHSNWVRALTVLPDGRLASGSDDKTIKLWDVGLRPRQATGRAARQPHEKSGIVMALTAEEKKRLQRVRNTPEPQKLPAVPTAAEKAQQAEKACQALRQRWPSDQPKAIITAYEQLIQENPGDSRYHRELGDYYVFFAEKASVNTQKINFYKKALSGFNSAMESDAFDEIAAQRYEAVSQYLAALNTPSPKTSHEKTSAAATPMTVSSMTPSLRSTTKSDQEGEDHFDMGGLGQGLESLFIAEKDVQLGRELGRGGFGIVYEGTYAFQPVAIKTYYGACLPEKEAREMRHELSMMCQLQHKYLVRLLGLVQEASRPPMIVMEYGAKGALYNYLHSDQAITWGLRLRMSEELARGLGYLHHKKIVHRDIKSLNVVLDEDFHAKWCDFGLAVLKLHSNTTSKVGAQSAVGTTRWMAPELLNDDKPVYSTASDIWALGMVYFELASRELPYSQLRETQVMFKISQGKAETVPEQCQQQVPGFGQLMQRCWLERSARPSAGELVDHLAQLNRDFVEPTEPQKADATLGYMDFSR